MSTHKIVKKKKSFNLGSHSTPPTPFMFHGLSMELGPLTSIRSTLHSLVLSSYLSWCFFWSVHSQPSSSSYITSLPFPPGKLQIQSHLSCSPPKAQSRSLVQTRMPDEGKGFCGRRLWAKSIQSFHLLTPHSLCSLRHQSPSLLMPTQKRYMLGERWRKTDYHGFYQGEKSLCGKYKPTVRTNFMC